MGDAELKDLIQKIHDNAERFTGVLGCLKR